MKPIVLYVLPFLAIVCIGLAGTAVRRPARDASPTPAEAQAAAQAARSRYVVARAHARQRQYAAAARLFADCERLCRDTNGSNPLGEATLAERAALERARCLKALGRRSEAATAFGRVIRDYPLSAAVAAAAREQAALNGGRLPGRSARDLGVAMAHRSAWMAVWGAGPQGRAPARSPEHTVP